MPNPALPVRRLQKNMRVAGYVRAATNLPHHVLNHGLPCTRPDAGDERVKVRFGRPDESKGLVAVRLCPKTGKEIEVVCTESLVLLYRPAARIGRTRSFEGPRVHTTVTLPKALCDWVRRQFPEDSFSAALRKVLEEVKGG